MIQREDSHVGQVYLPPSPGMPVGKFQFTVEPTTGAGKDVEVGAFVTADTEEGLVTGTVTDMVAIGSGLSPIQADLSTQPGETLTTMPSATVASASVLASEKMRPVRPGPIRFSSREEVAESLGQNSLKWPIPVGVVTLGDGSTMPMCLDGVFLAGPEAQGLTAAGKSGLASKTSFLTVGLRSMLYTAGQQNISAAALVFNVKGEDLIWLDKKVGGDSSLQQEDLDKYEVMGIPAEPFPDVTVYAPALPGGTESASPRTDAQLLRWDLPMIWPRLRAIFPGPMESDNFASLIADIDSNLIRARGNHRIRTINELDSWFQGKLNEADEEQRSTFWKSHHVATGRRAHKLIMSLVPRFGGLLSREETNEEFDIPDEGWRAGQVIVVDIAGLTPDVQAVVMSRTIERIFESAEAGSLGVSRMTVFTDELNQWAPKTGTTANGASIRRTIEGISTRGRYAGLSLFGAGQAMSKVSDLVRDNSATRALGVTDSMEITSGIYGKMPSGISEQVETMPKGSMLLWHYCFRQPVIVKFPRPAWQTGRPDPTGTGNRKKGAQSTLKVSPASVKRLTEGVPKDVADDIIAAADDPKVAVQELMKARIPDLRQQHLHAERDTSIDDDPFGLGDD